MQNTCCEKCKGNVNGIIICLNCMCSCHVMLCSEPQEVEDMDMTVKTQCQECKTTYTGIGDNVCPACEGELLLIEEITKDNWEAFYPVPLKDVKTEKEGCMHLTMGKRMIEHNGISHPSGETTCFECNLTISQIVATAVKRAREEEKKEDVRFILNILAGIDIADKETNNKARFSDILSLLKEE